MTGAQPSIAPGYANEPNRLPILPLTTLFAALLYVLTCAPGLVWQDSASFQSRVYHGDIRGSHGLAMSHPLYIMLAKVVSLVPIGPHAWRVNLTSAFCAAVALGFLADFLWNLTRSRGAAIVCVVLLGVSHTFWKHAVLAEVMTFYAAGLAIELWAAERFVRLRDGRWLIVALFVNGLNTADHLLAMLHAPAYLWLIVWAMRQGWLRARTLGVGVLAYLIGLSPYLVLIGRDIAQGHPVGETLRSALFGDGFQKDVLNTSVAIVRQTMKTAQYFVLNFPTPLILAAPAGVWVAWRDARLRWWAIFGAGLFAVNFVFAFRYPVADQYVFFLPSYILWAAFSATAVARFVGAKPSRLAVCLILAAFPAAVYEVVPGILKARKVAMPFRQDVAFRDAYAYFLRPRMNDDVSAERFARAALGKVAPNGLLIADYTVNNALVYARDILGVRPDVALTIPCDVEPVEPKVWFTPGGINPYASQELAYISTDLSPYMPEWIFENYDLSPEGIIFRLYPRDPSIKWHPLVPTTSTKPAGD